VIDTFHDCNLEISTFSVGTCQHLPVVDLHLGSEDSAFTVNDIICFMYGNLPVVSFSSVS